jgi:hypothetical protein
MCTWHMCSRWHISDFTQSPLTFNHLFHCSTKVCIQVQRKLALTVIRQQMTACFKFSICCKSPASQVLLQVSKEMEITGPHTANLTCDWLRHYGWGVISYPSYSTSSNFHIFEHPTKHLAGKQFATNNHVKQAVTS